MKTIEQRLEALRQLMLREHLAAFIFPSTDPHSGEYVPEHWKGRQWISGFNGSAGTAVVTLEDAAVWTDSRYFIAAEEQLHGTEFKLMKDGMPGTPSIAEWLADKLKYTNNTEVALDGMVNTLNEVNALKEELRKLGGLTLRTNLDPLKTIWTDRPEIPTNKVELQPLELAGEETRHKIERIRMALRAVHADGTLVSTLDDVAWTLNLRGSDVECNPVFVAYLLIEQQRTTLYINKEKLTNEVYNYLLSQQIDVEDYADVTKGLANYAEYNILLDPNTTNYTLAKMVKCQEIVTMPSPVPALKAVKNEAEIRGFRNAMLKDGIAMVKFLKWLKPAVEAGNETEMSLDDKLTSLRAEQPLFKGKSFETIVGYEAHGAIVHYEATPETNIPVKPHGLVLIDSGGQYQDGTTDITRTIALGDTTPEQRTAYTLVLKGFINFAMLKFPDGATGTQLDATARLPLWREGMNYLHGTGHGVGAYLNVHEGPHQVRMQWRPAPFHAGMTVTDEPGLYVEGLFGIRIENTLLTTPYRSTPFGEFLQFSSLTLCPIDTAPIELSMLTLDELSWLNNYHRTVYNTLAPHLDSEHTEWLKDATKPLEVAK
ncbi:MAG: aminopeptidase P family protein [Prevotella shahii]|uniref:aminopeptidase P family protein n=1 Tax=Hoylesella shahii TaxID=228603 RepID=UPI001CAFBA3B|nr:aminopeptidase P family protein [Hoylesella shahii]MBF1567983.1 aminopeptidase P family protein [Hoylesella shahii]